MEFSSPWKKALREVKHGFMVLGKKIQKQNRKAEKCFETEFVN